MSLLREFTATQYDPHELGRYIFTFTRWGRDPHYDESEYADEGETALQTLQTVLVEPQDPRFSSRARERSVNLPATGEDLRFSYWLQPEPAPVVYVLPGLGGHRKSGSSSALAEMAYGQGLSAVIISSSMNFEFMETASTVAVPGFAPADILDIHVALDAIHDELTGRYPGRITSAALMGMSLGAFHTLYIAATQERREKDLVRFDRYVAIAPPVRLLYGMETLDAFFNAPLAFPPEERQDRVENTLAKIVRLKERGLTEGQRLPFSRTEAEFIIGLAFRITLQNVIHSSQLRHDLGVLKTPVTSFRRANSYREIFEFSYMEYYYAFVLPYFIENSSQVRGPDDMIRLSDLRSLQARLARNETVRVFANRNDFLYAPEDLQWLARTFRGGRFHLFEDGGHLGNLHLPEVQDRIAAAFDGFAE